METFSPNQKGSIRKIKFYIQTTECSNYHTITLISHVSKVMLKILQARLQQCLNHEHPDVQAGFRKGRGTRDQIAKSVGSSKKQESSRKTSTSAFIDYAKPFDCVDHSKLWKILKEMETPDHLTCLLRIRSRSNSQNQTWNNGLVPNQERSMSRLYIVSLLI